MQANFAALDDRMSNRLRCDYVTLTIFFRLFIPAMFPQYSEGIYINSDVVLLPQAAAAEKRGVFFAAKLKVQFFPALPKLPI